MNDRALTKIGGVAGIAGGVVGIVFNLLHPATDDLEDTLSQIQVVADSDIWLVDHLMLMFGVLLVTAFVVALAQTITNSPAVAWARLGLVLQIVAAATMVVLIGIDGIASEIIFDDWAAASGTEREILTQISIALEHINVAVFTTFVIVQYGLVFLMIGLAVWFSDNYHSTLGIAALVLGAVGTVMGVLWAFIGFEWATVLPGFGAIVALLTWVVIMGVVMLRSEPDQGSARERAHRDHRLS